MKKIQGMVVRVDVNVVVFSNVDMREHKRR